jgi:hypothetical protein
MSDKTNQEVFEAENNSDNEPINENIVNPKLIESDDDNVNEESREGTGFARENIFPKDSIDRFGDDFVEVILQYLSFDEKVRFESISKQWARVIYKRQRELHLIRSQTEGKHTLNKLLKPVVIKNFVTGFAFHSNLKGIKKEYFESLLKKCPFITTIKMECFSDGEDFELIGKYCRHLKTMECVVIGFDEQTLNEFGLKYGHRFKALNFSHSIFLNVLIEKFFLSCVNLLQFTTDENLYYINEKPEHLPKLEVLRSLSLREENFSKLRTITDKYCKSLKEIEIYCYLSNDRLSTALSLIQKLENLRILKLYLVTQEDSIRTIDESLEIIGKSCTKIKDLHIGVYNKNIIGAKFFSVIAKYLAVEKLNLDLYNIDENIEGSVECFKELNLKQLQISYRLTDSFFEDIDLYLPNLKTVIIVSETDLTNKTLYSLSKLKNLRRIHFSLMPFAYKNITDDSIHEFLDFCQSIEVIEFNGRPNISNKTIDKLIATALLNPRKIIRFKCGFLDPVNEVEFAHIDMNSYTDRIPDNLKIRIRFNNIFE